MDKEREVQGTGNVFGFEQLIMPLS